MHEKILQVIADENKLALALCQKIFDKTGSYDLTIAIAAIHVKTGVSVDTLLLLKNQGGAGTL
jgi:hypothetical protein